MRYGCKQVNMFKPRRTNSLIRLDGAIFCHQYVDECCNEASFLTRCIIPPSHSHSLALHHRTLIYFLFAPSSGRPAVKKIGGQVTGFPRLVNNTGYGTVMVVGFGIVRHADLADPSRRHHFFFFFYSLSSSERISWRSRRLLHYARL